MYTPELRDMFETAVNRFGMESQINKTIEEMAELTQALLKYLRGMQEGADDLMPLLMHVQEERADVEIMLRQMDVVFGDNRVMERLKLEHLHALLA